MSLPPTVKITVEESELTVQFKLEDLAAYFTRSSSSHGIFTNYFGPGLRFGSYTFVTGDDRHIGLYLYTSKEYPAMSIHWTVAARSSTGELFFTKSMNHAFKVGEAIGWSKFVNLNTFQNTKAMKEENALVIRATLKFTPLYPIVNRAALSVIHHVVTGADVATHVRYVAYTTRSKAGRLGNMRTLFSTKDALMRYCTHLEDICEAGIPAISGSLLNASETPRRRAQTRYRDDDSDFEEDDIPDSDVSGEDNDAQDSSMSLLGRLSSNRTISNSNARSGHRSDSDTTIVVKADPDNTRTNSDFTHNFQGKTIVIFGAAARTWEAILYWLYTGVIVFAPLTSDGASQREAFVRQYKTTNPDRPMPVSCKSVYRIADALKLDKLKKQALQHLEAQLTIQTCLDELFSDFTSRYEAVKKMELLAVIKHWDELKSSSSLRNKMIDIATGKLPHAGPVMADLLMKASVKEEIQEEASASPALEPRRP